MLRHRNEAEKPRDGFEMLPKRPTIAQWHPFLERSSECWLDVPSVAVE